MASTRWICPAIGGLLESGEAEKGADRGEAQVARPDPDRSARLEIVEEGADERGVEIGQIEPRGRLAQSRLREGEQQPERIAVGGDGVRAGVAGQGSLVPPDRIELSTSALPRMRSTTELRRH
jgi:hypothetical protein